MIYLCYLVVAAAVVYLSNKASEYVSLIDQKTSLSGAFIGGVMLSAVTSLPELFTSISSTSFLDKPGLCMGNILGSNLFNVAILSALILICYRSFSKVKIARSHTFVTVMTALVYVLIALNMMHILDFELLTVNFTSIFIFILYIFAVKMMAGEEASDEEDEVESSLTVRQIAARFVTVSFGIILLSIFVTYITDNIAERLRLGSGLAGALFLGVATSLPEMASTIALFKMKRYNIAIGNIIGSNIFNFMILSVADVFYVGKGIYDFSDPKTVSLLVFGAVATPLMLMIIESSSRTVKMICPVGVLACYIGFLII